MIRKALHIFGVIRFYQSALPDYLTNSSSLFN
jgi:hypothetical protein